MLLETPIRRLGPADHGPLKAAVAALAPEVWMEDTMRQKAFSQHVHTRSVVLLFSSTWPDPVVERRSGWDRLSAPAMALIDQVVERHYRPGGRIIRALAAKLLSGGVISVHRDGHPSFAAAHRIHVPLVTNDQVKFTVRGETQTLSEGVAYEVSNLDYHAVRNDGPEDRVHFIFDYVPPA